MRFKDRIHAGQLLAQALAKYRSQDAVIYALPRGGVVLAEVIAKALNLPLSLIVVRKIGHPLNPEYAVCALSEQSGLICNEPELASIEKDWLETAVAQELQEIKRRSKLYLGNKPPIVAKGKIAIIVDDGIATGLTMMAAIAEIKRQHPKKIVVAVPIAARQSVKEIEPMVDKFVALEVPAQYLGSVGSYYEYFPQVRDGEVVNIIRQQTTKPGVGNL